MAEPAAARTGPGRPDTKTFLQMAWVANPFAYIAINTLIAVIPGVAARLHLSTTAAGFCCSVWCFSRFGAFLLLWRWNAWHYRFRWLLTAYITLVATFATVVLSPNVAVLVVGQLLFGVAVGLLYYSSLFYSMDLGDTKGEHGGIHEAVIGLGNFAGPAVGAGALYFLPQFASSGTVAVTVLLLSGLGGLLVIWRGGRRRSLAQDARPGKRSELWFVGSAPNAKRRLSCGCPGESDPKKAGQNFIARPDQFASISPSRHRPQTCKANSASTTGNLRRGSSNG